MAGRRKQMAEINVVPYIDVMLVLLIIFMVTAPLLTQGVKVDLPDAPSASLDADDEEPLVVSVKPDGSFYETPGISFITLDDDARICRQFDLFDLAHQMRLCDDLEDAGLLSPQLKEQWVTPMKDRLAEQLAINS